MRATPAWFQPASPPPFSRYVLSPFKTSILKQGLTKSVSCPAGLVLLILLPQLPRVLVTGVHHHVTTFAQTLWCVRRFSLPGSLPAVPGHPFAYLPPLPLSGNCHTGRFPVPAPVTCHTVRSVSSRERSWALPLLCPGLGSALFLGHSW